MGDQKHEGLEMKEDGSEGVTFEIQLTLADYLKLQLWCRRFYLTRSFLIFFVAVLGGITVVGLTSGMSLTGIGRNVLSDWKLYLALVLGGYFVSAIVPFLALTLSWVRNKLPRDMRISIGPDGMKHSARDHDLGFRWTGLQFIMEYEAAYIAKFGQHVVRIPKRDFTAPQLERFADIIRDTVPKAANRLVSN
jgi:hypothetical protein